MIFGKNYSEYKPEKMPTTRNEQFLDIVKHNFFLLIFIGFVLLLCFLPMLFSSFVRDYYYSKAASEYINGNINGEELTTYVKSLLNTMNIIVAACFTLSALGFSAITMIIRKLIWSEPIFLFSDLFNGIKTNFLKYLLLSLIVSLSIYGLYTIKTTNITSWVLKYGPFALFVCIVIPFYLHFIVQTNFYVQKASKLIKNSFLLYFAKPFLTLLFVLIFFVIYYLISLINIILIKILIYALAILVLMPLFLLKWFLLIVDALDKYVNKDLFPMIYRKGLHEVQNEEN